MKNVRPHIAAVLRQVLYIAPMLWILELFQNWLYHGVTGNWGWVYPGSQYHWFSFQTMGNWAMSVIVFYILYAAVLRPRRVHWLINILVVALTGFILEWVNGYLYLALTGEYLFLWEQSAFRFIDYIALPMWVVNGAVYHIMSTVFVNLHVEKE
ncbi:MAG TPA: hypothetical protein VKQ10_07710 [Spirochaetota bacterium]|nr:hypothetical protein [Spirochaetota bacterium]